MAASLVTLEGAREVRSSHGVVMRAHGALSERPDVLIVPGGGWMDRAPEGAWSQAQRGDIPAAIAARHAAGTTVASVCTGALLLARRRHPRRTARDHEPQLARRAPRVRGTIDVVAARLVDDGDVITAGAPACGLDLGSSSPSASAAPSWPRPPRASCSTSGRSDRPGLQPVGQGA